MTKAKNGVDKNLTNVVEQLDRNPVNSHHAQQLQQDVNDRRNQASMDHDDSADLSTPFSAGSSGSGS
ncbi:hypothetical protein DFQ01_12158 [Paenibacillus cellulosilyticus]|uniref:Uncharacterized protein n=1 Tax=Paenibacillus cellulosilyticus TaxID=375489 RepID=A0A2V2YP07_9BACL|nr:hypothetical protein [Paenibacillus cellulosilyticus]PWV97415.1 hypothetical protein DFQ01_12158 [Paenibacillus cellulosilyticus]QKS48544.1 hypothetical protein HUB94_30385 [Paenibacillus cellulosilyticus]